MERAPETRPDFRPPSASLARHLLARLRDIMAGSGSPQDRLNKIVQAIATETGADVCSCYALRAGEVLELFATVGLNQRAVHLTRLQVGEGLVGEVAARGCPISVADAPAHPHFAYRPETDEDPYHSLLGVPIRRGGRVRGVLVIQHQDRRIYTEEDEEILQTVAMVVAELVAGGGLVSPQEVSNGGDSALLPARVGGNSFNRGLGRGLAVLHQPQLTIRQMVAEDPEQEIERLHQALASLHSALDALLASEMSGEHRDILETYRMFAEDRGWLSRIREAINKGLTAEAAVQRVQDHTRARMVQVADPYLRERLQDLEDLTNRLLRHLSGHHALIGEMPEDTVLVARSLGPAELLDYDRRRLRGLVLEEGSASSHVVIVARALDIPVVGHCTDLLARIEPLDTLIVDGDNGQVIIRPGEDILDAFRQSVAARSQREKLYAEVRELPAVSRDGVAVSLHLNCGLLIDLPHLDDTGADGIGLYRTEIPFMVRSAYPDVAAQTELYTKVLAAAGERPVVFRTLDVGADKPLPYFNTEEQDNPALGWRAIRIALDRPAMLRQQVRALLRAAAGQALHVMFPMIAEVREFDAARRILDLEVARLGRDGFPLPHTLRVGAMVEVPALLWQMPDLLKRVDFLSIGSNDLLQYLYAADRGNPRVSERYDCLSSGFLRVLRSVVASADMADVPISLCGEMAGRPLEAMALLGIGLRSLSVAPQAVGPVKSMLRSLDVGQVRSLLTTLLARDAGNLRCALSSYAQDRGVIV